MLYSHKVLLVHRSELLLPGVRDCAEGCVKCGGVVCSAWYVLQARATCLEFARATAKEHVRAHSATLVQRWVRRLMEQQARPTRGQLRLPADGGRWWALASVYSLVPGTWTLGLASQHRYS